MKTLSGLIVSCQARADNPMHGSGHMTAMALAAVQGGARAIRCNGPDDIRQIRRATDVPIVGIEKCFSDKSPVYITPSCAAAQSVAQAGAKIIGIDATRRQRTHEPLEEIISFIRTTLKCQIFADVSTLEEGLSVEALGADYIATTLSGYTGSPNTSSDQPDLDLVRDLARNCTKPVVAEGRYQTPDQVRAALDLGAAAVVVGTAITNPREITRRFTNAIAEGGK